MFIVCLIILIQVHQCYTHREDLRNTAFSSINRRELLRCSDQNPLLNISINTPGPLANVQSVIVTVSGVREPSSEDWIGVFTQASHNYSDCPANKLLYLQTGDTSDLPLLCDYPLKFKFLKEDPGYLSCTNKACSASLTFRIINVRTSITFVLFGGGLALPCISKISKSLSFATPQAPLYGHLSSVNSSATSMKVTWISNDANPQYVAYSSGLFFGKNAKSEVFTFSKKDMCDGVPAPASDFGWHEPGYIHVATMEKLSPNTYYNYKYGSDKVGWSTTKNFKTPPAQGADMLKFAVFGDMGKAERDNSAEHYVQPGSLQVIDAIKNEIIDAVFHIGDISYATGFLVEWDHFLEMIEPVASKLPYMTAIGNHERDFPGSGSKYSSTDSGGECGVPYRTYFQMPVNGVDKPWYSINMGPVHFTIMSTEHDWTEDSEQFKWLKQDLSSVDRSRTPWVIFSGHRPMYSTHENNIISKILPGVDPNFPPAVEPLLQSNKVDLVFWGHVHNYERTCAVYKGRCVKFPARQFFGVDIYDATNYSAPVHAVVGMAGFSLDGFPKNASEWSLVRISEFGYGRVTVNKRTLLFEFISTSSGRVADSFRITK